MNIESRSQSVVTRFFSRDSNRRRLGPRWLSVLRIAIGGILLTTAPLAAEDGLGLRRNWEVYLLPHSHVDIGYTDLQSEVERRQWEILEEALDLARKTADNPAGSRFKWNVEVLWAVEGYLKQASPEKRAEFIEAVRKGWIGIEGLYCHPLGGLCRDEELIRHTDFAERLRREYGFPISAAMATDVAGFTWGIVSVLAQSGIRYFSLGPNSSHRIGYTRIAWDNRPFYWMSPCGRHRVLCYQTGNSYHPAFRDAEGLVKYLRQYEKENPDYPYEILHLRNCTGDNSGPDASLPDWVAAWNADHEFPKVIIATTAEFFERFESRYGKDVPTARGDFTPYWEDGAASSAFETAMNRASAERLIQAETLWALLRPAPYPDGAFYDAWRNVILYSEHTWGGQSYVRGGRFPPGSDGYKAQWEVKSGFARQADAQSRKLLAEALAGRRRDDGPVRAVEVLNTCSWPRTDLVLVPADWMLAGDQIRDAGDTAVAAQRLASGELAFIAKDVPPFGSAKFTLHPGEVRSQGAATGTAEGLETPALNVLFDKTTGAIASLRWKPADWECVDGDSGIGLNDYFHVQGSDPAGAVRNGAPAFRVEDAGPLVATVVIESDAPGCNRLVRRVRVIDGLNRVEIEDILDKKEIPLEDLLKDEPAKEGFHLGFAFNVPDPEVRIDTPLAVVRPEKDQLEGACKNWFSVQRFVDVSGKDCGVTWVSLDAPIVSLGAIARQPESTHSLNGWLESIEPSATLFAFVMNNYWTTNYQHDQPGPKMFRFAITPHGKYDPVAAARFGREQTQPLLLLPIDPQTVPMRPLIEEVPPGLVVTTLKPAYEGDAVIVRLLHLGAEPVEIDCAWLKPLGNRLWVSDLGEEAKTRLEGPITIPPGGIETIRIEPGEGF